MKPLAIIILILLILVEVGAGICLKNASKSLKINYFWLIAGILLYSLVALLFFYIIKIQGELAVVNIIWQGANIVLITFVSVLFFKEKLNIVQYVGMTLTLIGILLVNSRDGLN